MSESNLNQVPIVTREEVFASSDFISKDLDFTVTI